MLFVGDDWAEAHHNRGSRRIRSGVGPSAATGGLNGYTVYAISDPSPSRYRERHATSGAKSDPGDAHVWPRLYAPAAPIIDR